MQVAEYNVTVAECAPRADLFALFVQQYDNISTDTERRAGLSAISELIVKKFFKRGSSERSRVASSGAVLSATRGDRSAKTTVRRVCRRTGELRCVCVRDESARPIWRSSINSSANCRRTASRLHEIHTDTHTTIGTRSPVYQSH